MDDTREKLRLEYKLDGVGFADLTITVGDKQITVGTGYLSDTLGDLVRAAIFLTTGYTVNIHLEPEVGGLFSVLRLTGWDEVEVLENDESVFKEKGLRRSLPGAILAMAQDVLDTHGLEGYHAQWIEHEFPEAELDLLRHLIEKHQIKSI